MLNKSTPQSVDEYISSFPAETQELLKQMRETIIFLAPEAQEIISYQMPAYKFHGMLVYFAAYQKHIGFYPGSAGIEAFKNELSTYKWAKGSVQFPLNKPLPLDLIKRMVEFRVNQNMQKLSNKK